MPLKVPELDGFFDPALSKYSFEMTAYIRTGVTRTDTGRIIDSFTETKVFGSLQTFHKTFDFSGDASNSSSRDGKFWCKRHVIVDDGDLIKDDGQIFRLTNKHDYSFAGFKQFDCIRLRQDEVKLLHLPSEVLESRSSFEEVVEDDN